jgi:hypothetical protein
MIDIENLGPPVTWTIRDVPTGIRDLIVDRVGRGKKVADVLTQHILRGMHDSDESYASDKKSNVSDADLAALATATATLASADLPPGLKREAFAALRARFRAARGLPPAGPRSQPRLTDQSDPPSSG